MRALSLGTSPLLGGVITFSLFMLMAALIEMGDPDFEKKEATKIADFTMPKVEIEAQLDDDIPELEEILDEPPPEQEMIDIEIDSGDSGLNIASGAAKAEVNIDTAFGTSTDSDAIPVFVPNPRYPPRAQRQCKKGYGVVSVTITEIGTTKDIRLIEEDPEGFGFGKASAKAAEKLRYNPKFVDGVAVEYPGVQYIFRFNGCE